VTSGVVVMVTVTDVTGGVVRALPGVRLDVVGATAVADVAGRVVGAVAGLGRTRAAERDRHHSTERCEPACCLIHGSSW
jgi:hypothetical protein